MASYTEVMMGFIHDEHTRRYDIIWAGTTKINNIKYRFKTRDLTDYETMNDTCMCCREDTLIEELVKFCHCENYVELICILEKV